MVSPQAFSIKVVTSFSAKGNIELFANNTDSGDSARNELSHLKSALFALWLFKYSKTIKAYTIGSPEFEYGGVYFKQFGAERVKFYYSTSPTTFC